MASWDVIAALIGLIPATILVVMLAARTAVNMWRLFRIMFQLLGAVQANSLLEWIWNHTLLSVAVTFRQFEAARALLKPDKRHLLDDFLLVRRQLLYLCLGFAAVGIVLYVVITVFGKT